jgi:hypothetical protein
MHLRTYKKMIIVNQRLEEYHQHTRVVEMNTTTVILNTGNTIIGNDAKKFIARVMNIKNDEWVKNTDNILSGKMNESEIKKISASIGGKSCQKTHRSKILQNLNTGIPWNKNKTGCQVSWAKGLTKDTDSRIAKFAKFGEKNPMFGKKLSLEHKRKLSESMKLKILNGDFTPKSNNRNTHWTASLDGIVYRSSWEALYKYINPDAEYEILRLRYEYNNTERIYIVDFIDQKNKMAIEIKPKELNNGEKYNAKIKALKAWANENNFSVLFVDKEWLQAQDVKIDYDRFDKNTAEKVKKIYETR